MKNDSIIGKSVPRLESLEKVTGELRYLGDQKIQGMLHGKILRSDLAHAKILKIDVSRAEKFPGVVTVLTRDDILGNQHHKSHYGPVLKDQSIVALEKVRHVGDAVAAVAATRPEIAEEALDLIEVEYEELPAVLDPEEALAEGAPLLHEKINPSGGRIAFPDLEKVGTVEGTNLCAQFHLKKGDIDKGFAEADYIVENVFTSPATQHAPLESYTTIAQFERSGKLTVWSTTQNPFIIREQLAELFNLPLPKVRLIVPHLGGAYGAKLYPKLEPLVAALAHKAKRPVGVTLTREEVFVMITKHACKVYLKTGVKKDGTILAQKGRAYLDTGAYAEIGPRVCTKGGYTAMGPYEIPHLQIDSYLAYTNKVPAGAFRGFGVSQWAWAYESQVDIIARTLEMDPLELRLKNLLDEGGEFATGERVHSLGMKECLKKVASAIEWGEKSPASSPSKARGKGLAACIKATITPSISSAVVRLNEDGGAHVYVGTVEVGQGSDTVMAQIAAEELAIPIDQVFVVHSDTDSVPYDLATASSRSTFHVGRAVQLAAQDIKRQMACTAAVMFRISPEDVLFENQTVRVKEGESDQSLSYDAFLRKQFGMNGANLVGRGTVKTDTVTEKGERQTSAFWFAGAGAAEVEVDRETGMVRVVRYVTGADLGKAINPFSCEQQLRGGAIGGLGQALLEEMVYQEGLLINPNFFDYNLPRFLDMPDQIIPVVVERHHPEGPFGAKGVAETSIIPVPPAIANAIEDAVGVRIKEMPITPEKVLKALQQKETEKPQKVAASSTS